MVTTRADLRWSILFNVQPDKDTPSIQRHPFAFRDPSPQTVERIDAIIDDERHIAKQRIWRSAVDTEFPCRSDFAARPDHGR
jgi:hypothetical protein